MYAIEYWGGEKEFLIILPLGVQIYEWWFINEMRKMSPTYI